MQRSVAPVLVCRAVVASVTIRSPDERPALQAYHDCVFSHAPYLRRLFWTGNRWLLRGRRVDMTGLVFWRG